MNTHAFRKITVVVCILLFFLALQVIGIFAMYEETKQRTLENTWHEIENLATLIASQMDADALAQLKEGDENTTQFQKMISDLWAMQNKHADIRFVYTLTKKGDKLAFLTDSEYGHNDFTEPLIGYIYEQAPPEAFKGFESVSLRKEYYTDEWGTYMSAFAPIRNSTGQTVAIVGVDIPKEVIENRMRSIVNVGYLILITTTALSFFLILLIIYGIRIVREYQKRLEESEHKIQMALDVAEEGIWEYDLMHDVLHLGGGFWKSLGQKNPGWEHQITLEEMLSYIHPDDRDKFTQIVNLMRSDDGTDRFTGELRFVSKEGSARWIRVTGKVVTWEGDSPLHAIGTFVDLTDAKQCQNDLEQMYEKLVIFDSITRHDIANKNAVVSIAAEELGSAEPGSEEQKMWISEIVRASAGIRKQIQFASTYHSLGTGKPRWNDIDSIITTLIEDEQSFAITIYNECQGLFLYADPLINRAIYNLFENTLRHAGPDLSHIRCWYRLDGDTCILSIEDDGKGVPEHRKEAIFSRGVGENTGLGLYLIKEILRNTGLVIRETGTYGQGARFEIIARSGLYRIELSVLIIVKTDCLVFSIIIFQDYL